MTSGDTRLITKYKSRNDVSRRRSVRSARRRSKRRPSCVAIVASTYTGNFWDLDSDNVRAVKHGDVLVQKDTDLMRSVAHGSDGSRAFVMTHAQLTINANGETTVQFEVDKMVCS
jgi:hypothetical protein